MSAYTFLNIANNITGTLKTATDAIDDPVDIILNAGEGAAFPASNFVITIDAEILKCTSRTLDTLTCARAQEGTTKAAHLADALVYMNLTAGIVQEMRDAINDLESRVAALE